MTKPESVSNHDRWRAAAMDMQPNSALGQLTQMIAHDLNNHLQSMVLHLELLKPLGDQDEKARKHIARITEAVEHSEGVFRYLHDVRMKDEKDSTTNIEVVVEGIVMLLSGTLKRANLVCERSYQSDLLLVAMPMALVHQAVLNIIMNAIEASITGGTITVEARRQDKHIVLTVCDPSPGIPADDCTRATEPFFSTKSGDHFGLGLTVVQDLMDKHGGSFEIGSADNGGTRAALTLSAAS